MSEQAIIAALADARLSGEKLVAYPGPTPSKTAAFVVQTAVRNRLGWTHAGWKIGCTSERAQRSLKTDGPFPGPLYRERLFDSGAHVATHASNSRVTEPEIAFTLGTDLPPRDRRYEVDDTLSAVASVHPSIEVVNPRLPKGFDDTIEWYVADGGLSHALVLGPASKPPERAAYAAVAARVSINGRALYSGVGANALGGPELALTWLVNDLAARRIGLSAGDVVTTGVITEVFSCAVGDRVVADYGALGSVSLSF